MSVQSKICLAGMMLATAAHAEAVVTPTPTDAAQPVAASMRAVFAVLHIGYDVGGDTVVKRADGSSLTAGTGLTLAAGLMIRPSGKPFAIELALGYKREGDSYGEWSVSRVPLDAVVSLTHRGHRFGVGGTLHLMPTLACHSPGVCDAEAEAGTALGLLLQWGYTYGHFDLGARATFISYTAPDIKSESISGTSFGFFLGAQI